MRRDLTIRPFDSASDADYDAIAAIVSAVRPEYRRTGAEMKEQEARRDPKCRFGRWLAVSGAKVVGMGDYGQSPWVYHPRRFFVGVTVLPEQQGDGIGAALYERVVAELTPLAPISLHAEVREDEDRSCRFARDRGFVEEMRQWESRLDVRAFDPAPWAAARQRPLADGIALRSYADLADDPDRERKLYELVCQTFLDIPSAAPLTNPSFDQYRRQVLQSPNFLTEGVMIAVETTTGRFVGSSEVWRKPGETYLNTGLTGILREFRRRGIALALKLRVIDYARSQGITEIRTENATTNRPMLSINEALGFVKQPVWISFVKRTGAEEEA